MPELMTPKSMRIFLSQLSDKGVETLNSEVGKELQQRYDKAAHEKQNQLKAQDGDIGDSRTTRRVVPRYESAGQVEPSYEILNDAIKNSEAQKLHVSESGATSSHVPLRFDLIPRSLIDRAAERYTAGALKHGERGYQRGLDDRDFILNRINHIYEHLNKLFHPDYRMADGPEDEEGIGIRSIKDNLGAVIWGLGFLCEVLEHSKGSQIFIDLRLEGRVKTYTD
jgi:hypothetical protein